MKTKKMKIHFVDGMPLRAYEPEHVNAIEHPPGHEYVDYVAAEKVTALLDKIVARLNKNDKPNNVAVRAAIIEFKQE